MPTNEPAIAMETGTCFPSLASRRPHFESPGAQVWLLDPPGHAVVLRGHITRADAQMITGPAIEAILDRSPTRRFFLWYDARTITSYEAGARLALVDVGRSLGPKHLERIDVLMGGGASLVRMGITVALTAMTVVGVPSRVHTTVAAALRAGSGELRPVPHGSL